MMNNLKIARLRERILFRNRVSSGDLFTIRKINATFGVKARGLLLRLFTRMIPLVGLRITVARVRTILAFIANCKAIYRQQGMKGLVLWLKSNTVVLQQILGGFRLKDLTPLKARISRNRAGFPRAILSQDRARIRAGDWRLVKFYLTLFNLYRVLEFPGQVKLSTITDGSKANPSRSNIRDMVISYVPSFISIVLQQSGGLLLKTRPVETPAIFKSGPATGLDSVNTTPLPLMITASRLKDIGLDSSILYFIKYYKDGTPDQYPTLDAIFTDAANVPNESWGKPLKLSPIWNSIPLGKLGLKNEAAGKVRVFAMVDA